MKLARRTSPLRIVVIEPEPTDESSCGALLVYRDETLVLGVVLVHPRNCNETHLHFVDTPDPNPEPWIADAIVEQVTAFKARLERAP